MAASKVQQVPKFIRFLLSHKPKFDCYFVVGNESVEKPERIGAVKLMLMAHSEVMRTELEDSALAEKGDIHIKDIFPDTFKNLLKYIYGYDIMGKLSFEEADNMFYAAEKYMIKELKDRLAVRLMTMLNPNNVCSLLNNPACYTHIQLDSAITEILRYETDRVLASPQFPGLSPDGFLKLLEQNGLVVSEIELWRAAVAWGKGRDEHENETDLRQQMSTIAKRLRICTLTPDDICYEVVPAEVLSSEELLATCRSIAKKEKQDYLVYFCNEIEPRQLLEKRDWFHEIILDRHTQPNYTKHCTFTILAKEAAIELLPLECAAKSNATGSVDSTYLVDFGISVIQTENSDLSEINFIQEIEFEKNFFVPLSTDGRNITLQPESKCVIRMRSVKTMKMYDTNSSIDLGSYKNNHLSLIISAQVYEDEFYYPFPSNRLSYRVINPMC